MPRRRARARLLGHARRLTWLLGRPSLLYALQISYSSDRAKAAENLLFFYVPFGLLFVLLCDVRWTPRAAAALPRDRWSPRRVLLAGVGFVEYDRKSLFLNPKLVAANQYDNYFRVNSVFFDPSVYGRFLVLVMIAVTTVVLWTAQPPRRGGRRGRAGVAARGARDELLAVEHRRAAARPGGARRLALRRAGDADHGRAACSCSRCAVLLAAPKSLHFGLKGSAARPATPPAGARRLIEGGLELFAKRPLQGYGSGSFETEYTPRSRKRPTRTPSRPRTRSR